MSAAADVDRLGELLLVILDARTVAQLVGPARRVSEHASLADRLLVACDVQVVGRVFVISVRDRVLARVPGAALRTEIA